MKQRSDLLVSTCRQMTVLREVARMLTTTESKRIRFAIGGILVLIALYFTIVAAVAVPPLGGSIIYMAVGCPIGFWGFILMSSLFVEEESGTR
ncbi:MAG: hypothetical protein KAX20_02940 [Candidatus Omnitrophica bacterium]|nr:hypothetical protein [Candidatus Omnitrophota bacterium]